MVRGCSRNGSGLRPEKPGRQNAADQRHEYPGQQRHHTGVEQEKGEPCGQKGADGPSHGNVQKKDDQAHAQISSRRRLVARRRHHRGARLVQPGVQAVHLLDMGLPFRMGSQQLHPAFVLRGGPQDADAHMPGATQHKIDEIPHGVLKLAFMPRQNMPAHHNGHFL